MKILASLTTVVLVLLFYVFYLSQFSIQPVLGGLSQSNSPFFYDYRGVINVQSDQSSGSSSAEEIISEAKRADLDFIVMTDINIYGESLLSDGYYDGLFVAFENEYTYLDSRILFLQKNEGNTFQDSFSAQVALTDLLSQNLKERENELLILADPIKDRPTWTGPLPQGLTGIEILNSKSFARTAWQDSKLNVIFSILMYPFNSQLAFLRLFQEPREILGLWDKEALKRKIVGFAGVDASARAIPWANYLLKFPSYQKSFGTFTNHLLLETELTGNYARDRQKIFQALSRGNFYMSLNLLGDPKGFYALLRDGRKILPPGSQTNFSGNLEIEVKLPQEPNEFFEIILVKDGEGLSVSNDSKAIFKITTPGVYRVLVRMSVPFPFPEGRRWVSWIYTNHFRVF